MGVGSESFDVCHKKSFFFKASLIDQLNINNFLAKQELKIANFNVTPGGGSGAGPCHKKIIVSKLFLSHLATFIFEGYVGWVEALIRKISCFPGWLVLVLVGVQCQSLAKGLPTTVY